MGKRVFEDVIKYLETRTSGLCSWALIPRGSVLIIRREDTDRKGETQSRKRCEDVAEIGVMCLPPTETRKRGVERILSQNL